MFLTVRNALKTVIPKQTKYWLVRNLPYLEIGLAKNLRGVELIADADQKFFDLYKSISSRSLLDIKKAYFLYCFARETAELSGDVAELGVYRGAGSRIIYEAINKKKKFYLFDSWEGLPKTENDGDENWEEGELDEADIDEVKKFLPEKEFIFVKGFFPQSLSIIDIDPKDEFSFIHLDLDISSSTIDALNHFYPKMQKGGIIVLDDYGVLACQGVKIAVDNFFMDKIENPVPLLTGQGLIIKQ